MLKKTIKNEAVYIDYLKKEVKDCWKINGNRQYTYTQLKKELKKYKIDESSPTLFEIQEIMNSIKDPKLFTWSEEDIRLYDKMLKILYNSID